MTQEEAIKKVVGTLNMGGKLLHGREIKALPGILRSNEMPEGLISGQYGSATGILVATNERVIIISNEISALKIEDFPYNRIISVQHITGMMGGEITISTAGDDAQIKKMPNKDTKEFADHIRAKIAAVQKSTQAIPGNDTIAQLERLAQLKEKGILTDEEFLAEKHKLLG